MNGDRELPLRPKLQQYEKQAKDLVKAFKYYEVVACLVAAGATVAFVISVSGAGICPAEQMLFCQENQ